MSTHSDEVESRRRHVIRSAPADGPPPPPPQVEVIAPQDSDVRAAVITGLRVEEVEKGVTYDDGASVVMAGTPVTFI